MKHCQLSTVKIIIAKGLPLHPFNDLFSRTICHQKGKTILDFNEEEMMGWQWNQLDHTKTICTLLQTDNHASTHHSNFYRPDALPGAQPTVSNH